MSKTIITKKLTIIALIVISFIIIIAIAFAPLFFIKQIIFKDVGNVAPEIVYIQNYNPFAPRIYWINEDTGSSTKNVVYAQLTRTGIWSFDGFDPLDQATGKICKNKIS